MKGKKKFLSDMLLRSRMLGVLQPLVRHSLIIFNFHRIRNDGQAVESSFDDGVFGPTVSVFEKQMEWLSGRFNILSETELIQLKDETNLPSEPSVAITFDDGYIDNYTLAYPVLKRFEIPAIFFIPSAPLIERKLGWWDIIAYLVKNTSESIVRFKNREFFPREEPEPMIAFFKERMALDPATKTQTLIPELASLCNVALPSRECQDRELMTWEQLREVSQNRIAIGSHTHSHRVLATLSSEVQPNELSRSKKELERRIGLRVRTLSFPVGGYEHFSPTTQKLAKECGYELAFSFNTGVNRRELTNPYDIKRVSAHEDISLFAASTIMPRIFIW